MSLRSRVRRSYGGLQALALISETACKSARVRCPFLSLKSCVMGSSGQLCAGKGGLQFDRPCVEPALPSFLFWGLKNADWQMIRAEKEKGWRELNHASLCMVNGGEC